ncbi:MAG: helix-turn-helix domain-containing protein [Pontibacterium sp.]
MSSSSVSRLKNAPEQECDFQRDPDLGYEADGSFGSIRILEHGYPNPLVRWHFHEEYELHLITETRGKVFVGDYIGHFEPGHLVLTGPRLPHNWISSEVPPEGSPKRDLVMQFSGDPIRKAAELLPEFKEILPLLDRAEHGIEFKNVDSDLIARIYAVRNTQGMERFIEFCALMRVLTRHGDYKLLSSVKLQSFEDDQSLRQISTVVDYISEHYHERLSMADVAEKFDMSESRFSRFFRKSTGNTFTNFVSQIRINRACQLLLETEQYISTVCYNVGFNNVANFNRRFMEVKGMTPSEFRRLARSR